MDNRSDLLMLRGVTSVCADCDDERVFVPVEDGSAGHPAEYCCTSCDAGVFLFGVHVATAGRRRRVA